MAANEPARNARTFGGAEHGVEPVLGRRRNAHENLVGASVRDGAIGLVQTADDADPEDAPAPHARVVVEEADDARVAALAELAREAPARAAGADDEHAPPTSS